MNYNYPGGKSGAGTYQTIINYIPKHKVYVEAFLGSGAILRYKKPALIDIGIELDTAVIDKFDYNGRAGLIVINGCAISFLKKTFPVPGRIVKNVFTSATRSSIDILNYDASLRQTDPKDIFIYADPPYPKSVRSSSKDIYNYEMTDEQHLDLLQTFLTVPAGIAVSSYESGMYNDILKGWNKMKFMSKTRKGLKEETLYMNYEPPTELHDYRYLGKDFTERQRIKRKLNRICNKLSELPLHERNAIIEAINNINLSGK